MLHIFRHLKIDVSGSISFVLTVKFGKFCSKRTLDFNRKQQLQNGKTLIILFQNRVNEYLAMVSFGHFLEYIHDSHFLSREQNVNLYDLLGEYIFDQR